ncbi:MAG: TolC family protein [Gammaproteobacteria bacterium]|nr:TolC family protein [Gammaproteobacteria bacterium]
MSIPDRTSVRRYAVTLALLWLPGLAAATTQPPHSHPAALAARASADPQNSAADDAPGAGALAASELVAQVLERNPGFSAMRSAVQAADAQIYPAGALEDPTLTFGLAPETLASNQVDLREVGQISQAIPWPGTLRLKRSVARSLAESAAQQAEDFRLQLAAKARAAYAQWDYVHCAMAINERNQTLLKRLTQVAETAYASGQAPEQDVLQAEVESTRLQNQALELERRRRQVQAAINGLLNREPDAPLPPPAGLPSTQILPGFSQLRAAALARYPQLKSLDAEIAARKNQVSLARKKYYPDFRLFADYRGVMDPPVKRWTAGVAINLPFDLKKRNAWLDQANAELHQSQSQWQDAWARLLSELQQAYAAAEQARQTLRLYDDRLLPLSRLNLQAAEADYSSSGGSFLNLITAEQRYLDADLEQAAAQATLFTQLATLDYQTGGALFPAPPAPAQDAQP